METIIYVMFICTLSAAFSVALIFSSLLHVNEIFVKVVGWKILCTWLYCIYNSLKVNVYR